MREKIQEVMRYSGPRMLFLYPIETLMHYLHIWKIGPTLFHLVIRAWLVI